MFTRRQRPQLHTFGIKQSQATEYGRRQLFRLHFPPAKVTVSRSFQALTRTVVRAMETMTQCQKWEGRLEAAGELRTSRQAGRIYP